MLVLRLAQQIPVLTLYGSSSQLMSFASRWFMARQDPVAANILGYGDSTAISHTMVQKPGGKAGEY